MKLKGISKLVLAGTALAATAATLTTATYAWYVTNASVDVLGASGSVAGAEASGNLLVAQNRKATVGSAEEDRPGAYKVGLSSLDAASIAQSDNLNPQTQATADVYLFEKANAFDATVASANGYYTKDANGVYTAAATQPTSENFGDGTYFVKSTTAAAHENDWVKADGTATTATFLTYKFWLKAEGDGETISVTPELTVTNTTANVNAVKQTAYTGTAGVSQGQSFAVDAVYALRMNVTLTELTNDTLGSATASVTKGSVVDIATDYTRLSGTVDPEDTNITDLDANTYYNAIMGEVGYGTKQTSPIGQSVTPSVTSWGAMSLHPGVDTLVTISFWLEGTDAECYDSCMSQAFKFDFNFSV